MAVTLAEINAQTVVLRELSSGEGDGIDFQRALSFDDQDRRLGQDTYAITTPSGRAFYGGLRGVELEGSVLCLWLTDEAASTLGLDGHFVIRLDITAEELKAVRDALPDVLGPEANGLFRIVE
ncbi:MAG TPA: Imm10 family immunity protein [Candidatus Dormibacteraeota bacterium]|nr:Imm10 family immunity protein [Candidatus Dormibacteraeota bacterium]